eukprot:gene8538-11540_t
MPPRSKRWIQLQNLQKLRHQKDDQKDEEDENNAMRNNGTVKLRRKRNQGNTENNGKKEKEGSDQEDMDADTEPMDDSGANSRNTGAKSLRSSAKNNQSGNNNSSNGNKSSTEEERVWVQCNNCDKWRSLPHHVNINSLPDIWYCSLNTFDPSRMNCEAAEEDYKRAEEEQHGQVKSFLKLWTKRLKNGDRAENRLPPSALTRGRKRKLDVEWIRCCNPSCGKWRAVLRSVETIAMMHRLNKNKKFGAGPLWYCSMNSWDDSTSSCAAPQEPLWNCRWNISNSTE